MAALSDSPIMPFATPKALAAWIARQPAGSPGVWLKLAKKASGHASITYEEAVNVALCHGWIDGLKRPFDAEWWIQRFTPRTARSKWSKINCTKAEKLIGTGAMKPAGQKQVDLARADGRWESAYGGARSIEIPPDLTTALKRKKKAAAFFQTIINTNRYAILYRLHDAKRPETRAKRLAGFVAMLARGETIHPQPARAVKPVRR